MSAQLPVESLSSLGSNTAGSVSISSADVGRFAEEVPAPYFSTGESRGRGRSAAHGPRGKISVREGVEPAPMQAAGFLCLSGRVCVRRRIYDGDRQPAAKRAG